MLAMKSAVKFMSETRLLALILTLNLAYGPLDVGYTK